ncbi:RodZ domain-containing protein [Atopobiaceae bacterium HCP3S3_A4]
MAARYSAILLERRRQLGITLGKAARDLRMKEQILQAFEEGDFASIPSNGYTQGMLASYARYLGLDDSAVVRQFNEDLYVYEHGYNERRRRSREQVRSSYSDRGSRERSGAAARSRSAAPQGGYGRPSQGQSYSQRVPQQGYPSQQRNPYIDGTERFGRQSQRIETRPVERGYTDDMKYGQTTSPYEAANSVRGRVSSRNIANVQRPNVDRRRPQPGRHPQRPKSFLSNENMVIGLGILVAILLTIIIVMSVSSCVNMAAGESSSAASSSVPVSTADNTSSQSSTSSGSEGSGTKSSSSNSSAQTTSTKSDSKSSSTTTTPEKTEVVVTVADSSVSWVEIVVDGKSVVAESVTGPWTQTYEPKQSMSIQVGDTSAVTVTKNGENQSFDAKTSGLGTITIKVPQTQTTTTDGTSTDASKASKGTDSSSTSTDSTQSGTTSTGSTSATTNGASATSTKSASTTTSKA